MSTSEPTQRRGVSMKQALSLAAIFVAYIAAHYYTVHMPLVYDVVLFIVATSLFTGLSLLFYARAHAGRKLRGWPLVSVLVGSVGYGVTIFLMERTPWSLSLLIIIWIAIFLPPLFARDE